MTDQSDSATADPSAHRHGAAEDGGGAPARTAALSGRLVEGNTTTPPSVARSSPPYPETGNKAGQGLLLVHNCTHPANEPKRPQLPEPEYGWPELFEDGAIGFRPAEAVDLAASMFPALEPTADPTQAKFGEALTELGDGRWIDRHSGEILTQGPKRFTLTISGGLIRVAVNDVRSGQTDDLELIDAGNLDEDDIEPWNPNCTTSTKATTHRT